MSARSAQPVESVSRAAMGPRMILLVGFMGSGKSTVGAALSQRLGWRFEDLDRRIEARERRSIAEIFRDSGEAAFRQAEMSALRELLGEMQASPAVVALGGGAVTQEANRDALQTDGAVTVWLDAPLDELWQRCAADREFRPLMQDPNQFRQLYESRRAFYMKAGLHVDTRGRVQDEVAQEIARRLGLDRYTKET
jgi:shikimate kinase